MSSKKYVNLPGSHREPMAGATKAGPTDPNEVMHATIVLRPRSGHARPVGDIVATGQRITREEYQQRYGADPAEVQKVLGFASSFGLALDHVDLGARTLRLTGTAGAFSKAFQVEFAQYKHAGGAYRGREGAISVPQELGDVIQGVHGLDNRPQAKPHFRVKGASRHRKPAAAATSYTALQIAKAYNFPSSVNGGGQTIGIIELGGGFTSTDLSTYFGNLKISPAPNVLAVSVDGAQNQPTGDTNGPDTEVMLDIEVAGAIAPAATIAVYFAPNTDAGFLDAINQAVMDNVNKPSVISISWGGPESSWTAQSLQSYNSALQSAAAVGVTICVACGDNGSTDGVTDGLDHVDFPASSPYALACGGTRLNISGSAIVSEVVWNDLSTGDGATGGGVSGTFPIPSWQADANVPPSTNPKGYKGRGTPDVSGDADPQTGYDVQVDGLSFPVGGTSAVAPLWAGLIALMNQSLGKSVGYFNPTLYQNIAETGGAFHDITSGNNGDYSAGPGWDACTGWGSPNGSALLTALAGDPKPKPTPKPKPNPKPKPKPKSGGKKRK